jgi:hypothetical protein
VVVLTFGQLVAQARVARGVGQAALANQIRKSDGTPISFHFLSDVERGRRLPPEYMIPQFSMATGIPVDVLYFLAGLWPPDLRSASDIYSIQAALTAVRSLMKS